jgi:hypothetical protein
VFAWVNKNWKIQTSKDRETIFKTGNTADGKDKKMELIFLKPVETTKIKIEVVKCINHCGMRIAVLTSASPSNHSALAKTPRL